MRMTIGHKQAIRLRPIPDTRTQSKLQYSKVRNLKIKPESTIKLINYIHTSNRGRYNQAVETDIKTFNAEIKRDYSGKKEGTLTVKATKMLWQKYTQRKATQQYRGNSKKKSYMKKEKKITTRMKPWNRSH
ncbi:hypothetical protein DPMN_025520 [Dreissena polymorpha]|uniref:Uncharacterized protein n=1 Tax=Dreissena polymorpha TaxID=45954 RepID=A0A9D4LPZ3_DREPO|nr:hypothetical protein DPMN_025520 [Dreissena polymorpha]